MDMIAQYGMVAAWDYPQKERQYDNPSRGQNDS
jgi:hypothetical protein